MGCIVSIKFDHKESGYWLTLDDGRQLKLSPTVYLESGYAVDDQIAADDWHHLLRQEEKAQLRRRALLILDHRDRSEAELRKRLQSPSDGSEPSHAVIDELLDELRTLGLIDDQRFVERALDQHLRRGGHGKGRLAHRLQRLGIAKDLVHTAVQAIDDDDELHVALDWAKRRLRGLDPHEPAVIRRLYNGLLRRGFGYAIAHSVIARLNRSTGELTADRCDADEVSLDEGGADKGAKTLLKRLDY